MNSRDVSKNEVNELSYFQRETDLFSNPAKIMCRLPVDPPVQLEGVNWGTGSVWLKACAQQVGQGYNVHGEASVKCSPIISEVSSTTSM